VIRHLGLAGLGWWGRVGLRVGVGVGVGVGVAKSGPFSYRFGGERCSWGRARRRVGPSRWFGNGCRGGFRAARTRPRRRRDSGSVASPKTVGDSPFRLAASNVRFGRVDVGDVHAGAGHRDRGGGRFVAETG